MAKHLKIHAADGLQVMTCKRLVDKFYRISTESVGVRLGLSIARGMVESRA